MVESKDQSLLEDSSLDNVRIPIRQHQSTDGSLVDEVENKHLFQANKTVDQADEKKKKSRKKRASDNLERKQNLEQLQK